MGSVDNLLSELNKPGPIFPKAEVTPSQHEQMAALAESAGWEVPEKIQGDCEIENGRRILVKTKREDIGSGE